MELSFLDRTSFRSWERHVDTSGCYVIPMGGSNALGAKGCAEIPRDIHEDYDLICCPVGTGGTLAGLAIGLPEGKRALGFSVLKGGGFLNDDVKRLQLEASGGHRQLEHQPRLPLRRLCQAQRPARPAMGAGLRREDDARHHHAGRGGQACRRPGARPDHRLTQPWRAACQPSWQAGVHPGEVHQVTHPALHRADGQVELAGDRGVGEPGQQQHQDPPVLVVDPATGSDSTRAAESDPKWTALLPDRVEERQQCVKQAASMHQQCGGRRPVAVHRHHGVGSVGDQELDRHPFQDPDLLTRTERADRVGFGPAWSRMARSMTTRYLTPRTHALVLGRIVLARHGEVAR